MAAEIKITADTRSAERDIKRLEGALEGINSVADGAATALAGITAAAAAMGFAILKTLDAAGQLIDSAAALGVSAQSLQVLQHAATQAGVGADELTGSLIRLSNNLGSAFAAGTGPAIDAMKKLGIPMQEIMAMRPDAQFARIATELNKITNPAERNAMAIDLLGKQGPKLLAIANNTEIARKEMERLGLALSDLDVAALDEAGDAVDSLKSMFESGLKKAVADIAPYIVAIVKDIKLAIEEAGGFEAVWQNIKDAIKTALNIAVFTAAIFALAKMVGFAVGLVTAIRTAGTAMALFNAIVMRNPLMLAVGAALLLAKVLGIDVVGAVTDSLFPTEKMAVVTTDIADKADKIKKTNEATVPVKQQINALEQKALDALNETIVKLQTNAQFQRDILNLGEEEAAIRKVISEEAAKLAKVGLSMQPAQEQSLRNALAEEASIKRQITLRKEQSANAFSAISENYSPTEKALQKHLDFQLSMQGNTKEQIDKLREQQFAQDGRLRAAAEASAQLSLKKTIDGEIGKYDSLYGMRLKHTQDLQTLLDLEVLNAAGAITLEKDQFEALQRAKSDMIKTQQLERDALEKATQEKIYQYELTRIQNTLMAEQGAMASRLSMQDQATLQAQGQQERQRAMVQERINFEKKSDVEKAAFAIDQGAQMFSALGAQNKKAFEAAKAFNIANAIMNTYMAATKALATYPPPFNFVAAAAAVGMGLAQVAQIRSQQYSGRQLGGPVMGGQPYLVGENGPEIFTPNNTGSITPNHQLGMSEPVNINFNITTTDASGFDDLLVQRRGLITQMVSDAMSERGQRSVI